MPFIQTGVYMDDLDAAFWASAREECSVAAGILVVLLAASWLAIRSIVRPLDGLRRTMQSLADGDLQVVVPKIETKDEIGAMATTVGVFQTNMREVHRLRSEQETLKTEAERSRKEILNRLANEFESRLGTLAETLSGASTEASTCVQTVAAAAEELTASISESPTSSPKARG